MRLSNDLNEFIELLLSHQVEFLVVGAYALAFYSRPRFTGDIDFWISCDAETAGKMEQVIDAFGFSGTGLSAADFETSDQVIQLGVAPNRLDILTGLSGLEFQAAWQRRVQGKLGDFDVFYLSKADLLTNKKATGRPQDLADAATLENGVNDPPSH